MVNKRLTSLSCNEEEFQKAGPIYKEALKASDFSDELKFSRNPSKPKRRSRKVTWFNPPFNSNVKTNIGRDFLRLVREQFPPTHKYRKIFNKNTLKISYSCMENIENIIKSHNAKVLKEDGKAKTRSCNCPESKKDSCPLDGHCLSTNIVYKAEVKSKKPTKIYYGICEPTFKKRLANHKTSFVKPQYRNVTELSKYIWQLNDQNESYEIAWTIHDRAPSYKCGSYKCMLCIAEKLAIMKDPELNTVLNKNSDLISWCPHRKKFEL